MPKLNDSLSASSFTRARLSARSSSDIRTNRRGFSSIPQRLMRSLAVSLVCLRDATNTITGLSGECDLMARNVGRFMLCMSGQKPLCSGKPSMKISSGTGRTECLKLNKPSFTPSQFPRSMALAQAVDIPTMRTSPFFCDAM